MRRRSTSTIQAIRHWFRMNQSFYSTISYGRARHPHLSWAVLHTYILCATCKNLIMFVVWRETIRTHIGCRFLESGTRTAQITARDSARKYLPIWVRTRYLDRRTCPGVTLESPVGWTWSYPNGKSFLLFTNWKFDSAASYVMSRYTYTASVAAWYVHHTAHTWQERNPNPKHECTALKSPVGHA